MIVANAADFASVLIKATPDAKQAYERQPFQVLLHILDNDSQSEPVQREVIYAFPEQYVSQGDIELSPSQPKTQARFTLKPTTVKAD